MLKRVMPLIDLEQAKAVSRYTIRDALKRIYPDRHIHELRYTFITRAKECVQKGNQKIIIASKQSKFNMNRKAVVIIAAFSLLSIVFFRAFMIYCNCHSNSIITQWIRIGISYLYFSIV